MFPNTRLMVVAILAAIAGIGCGLGLFATFRVNHEPLTRFAEGSPPLQLAFDNLALGPDARVPLEARLPLGTAGKMISAPVIVPTPAAGAEPAGADAAPAASAVQEPAAADAAADQSNTASLATVAESPERSSAAPKAIAIAPSQQEATPAAQDQPLADPAAPTPSIAQTTTIATAADDQQPTSQATKPEETKTAKPARVLRPAVQVRRPVKIVHIRRTVTTTAAQPSYQYSQPTYSQSAYSPSAYSKPAYSQSAYGWTSGTAQASQPVKRVVAKRHRAPTKTVPAVQATPAAATAGLSNNQ